MAGVILIECWPRRPSDGVVQAFRVIGGAPVRADYFGQQWIPALATLPQFSSRLAFDGRSFAGAAQSNVGEISVALGDASLDVYLEYLWANAAVTIRQGDAADADGALVTIWTGRAATAKAGNKHMVITLVDPGEELRRPVLAAQFAGTGDLEGPADIKGQYKPRVWGVAENVPATLIDPAYGIYLVNDGACTITGIRDGGVPYSTGANHASLAALRAATVAAGTCATCTAQGLIRPWTAPRYKLTADISAGGVTTAANIAEAIVTARTGVTFASGTVSAFNGVQSAEIGVYIEDDRSIAEVLDQIFGGVGAWWKLTTAGEIQLGRWEFGAPAQSFEFEVADVACLDILPPTHRRQVGYRRNFAPLSDGEIAAAILTGDIADIGLMFADTNNLIKNPAFVGGALTGWTTAETVDLAFDISGLSGAPTKYGWRYAAAGNNGHTYPLGSNVATAGIDAIPVAPGEKFYVEGWGRRDGTANGRWSLWVRWYDAAGAHLSYSEVVQFSTATVPTANTWTKVSGAVTAPAGAAFAYFLASNRTEHTTGTWYGALPRYTRYELGATNGATWGSNVAGQPADAAILNAVMAQTQNLFFNGDFRVDDGTGLRPAGILPTRSNNDLTTILWHDGVGGDLLLKSASDTDIGCCLPAIAVDPNMTYVIVCEAHADEAGATSGFYIRVAEYDYNLPAGKTHVGAAGSTHPNIQEQTREKTSLGVENVAPTTSPTTYTATYTPTATAKWASVLALKWTGMDLRGLIVRKLVIYAVPSNALKNNQITINANGTLSGAGGGSVTIGGLGYAGDLAATRNDIYTQTSDPGAVANGSYWYSSSTKLLKRREAGAWVTVSSYNTGALADKNTAGTGDIDNDAITTAKVLDGAGAIMAVAYTSGSISTSSDTVWSIAQQVTVTDSTGETISIQFAFHAINLGSGWTKNSVRVRRNLGGVDTYVWGGSAGKSFIIDNDGMSPSGGATDTVNPGDDPTYFVEFKKFTGYTSNSLSVSERHMVAFEDKFA